MGRAHHGAALGKGEWGPPGRPDGNGRHPRAARHPPPGAARGPREAGAGLLLEAPVPLTDPSRTGKTACPPRAAWPLWRGGGTVPSPPPPALARGGLRDLGIPGRPVPPEFLWVIAQECCWKVANSDLRPPFSAPSPSRFVATFGGQGPSSGSVGKALLSLHWLGPASVTNNPKRPSCPCAPSLWDPEGPWELGSHVLALRASGGREGEDVEG